MTFKKLVREIGKIKDIADRSDVFGMIDKAFEAEKITFEDHELLYDIADWYGYGKDIWNMNKIAEEEL